MFEVFIRVWLCKHYITDFLYSVSVVVTAAHKILFFPFNTCYPAKVGNERDVIHCFLNEYNYVKKGYIFPLPLNLLARILEKHLFTGKTGLLQSWHISR